MIRFLGWPGPAIRRGRAHSSSPSGTGSRRTSATGRTRAKHHDHDHRRRCPISGIYRVRWISAGYSAYQLDCPNRRPSRLYSSEVPEMPISAGGTDGIEYTERLDRMGNARWKRALNAQAPYRWNMRRLHLGETLDVGCGLGRNLQHLEGHGVGVDTNPTSVEICRSKGLEAFTVEEFLGSELAAPRRVGC